MRTEVNPAADHLPVNYKEGLEVEKEAEPSPLFDDNFFYIQLCFADKISRLRGISFVDAVLNYTSIPRRLGLAGLGIDQYAASISGTTLAEATRLTCAEYARVFMKARADAEAHPKHELPRFGCFSFDITRDVVHIHFANKDRTGEGPLSELQRDTRLKEMHDMFAYIKQHYPHVSRVAGGSWLYGKESYRTLFPPEYTASMKWQESYDNHGLWGQFIDRNNRTDIGRAERFLDRLGEADTSDYLAYFDYQTCSVQAPIEAFYSFYGV